MTINTHSYNTIFKQHFIAKEGNLTQIAYDFHRSSAILSLNGIPCTNPITPSNIIDILSQLFEGASPQLKALLIDYCINYLHQGGLFNSLQSIIITRLINYDYNFPSLIHIDKEALSLFYNAKKKTFTIQEAISCKTQDSETCIAEEIKHLTPHPFPPGDLLFKAVREQIFQFDVQYNNQIPILETEEIKLDTTICYFHPILQNILDERSQFEKEIDHAIQKWQEKHNKKIDPQAAHEFIRLVAGTETQAGLIKEKEVKSYLLLNQTLQLAAMLHTIETEQEALESAEKQAYQLLDCLQNQHFVGDQGESKARSAAYSIYVSTDAVCNTADNDSLRQSGKRGSFESSLLAYLQTQCLDTQIKKLNLHSEKYQDWMERYLLKGYLTQIKIPIGDSHMQRYLNKMEMLLKSKHAQDFEKYVANLSIYANDPEVCNLIGELQIQFSTFIVQTAMTLINAPHQTLHISLQKIYTQFECAISQSIKQYINTSTYSLIQEKVILILRQLLSVLPSIALHFIQNKILHPEANPRGLLFKTCQAQFTLNTVQPIAQAIISS